MTAVDLSCDEPEPPARHRGRRDDDGHDNFWRLAWIFAAVVPFVLFLGRRPRIAEAPADVERPSTIIEA